MNDTTLQTALDSYFDNFEVVSHEAMAHGRENTSIKVVLVDGKQLILRIWGEEHSHIGRRTLSDITSELAFMMHCHEAGIAVPKVYISKRGLPYTQLDNGENFMIMDFVSGTSPQNLTPIMVHQVAEAMAHMHLLALEFPFPEPRNWLGTVVEMTEDAIELYTQTTEVDGSVREYLDKIRKDYRTQLADIDLSILPSGPIHGDIFWENLKFEGDKLAGIFDFDDCRTSYFLEDILKTLLYDFDDPVYGFYGKDGNNVREFMQAYQAIRPLTNVERKALPAMFTVSYAYRLASYVRRLLRGNVEYEARIPILIETYNTRKDKFPQQALGE